MKSNLDIAEERFRELEDRSGNYSEWSTQKQKENIKKRR